jgi:hypothetical protein
LILAFEIAEVGCQRRHAELLTPVVDMRFVFDRRQYQKSVSGPYLSPEQLLHAGVDAHAVNQVGDLRFGGVTTR